MPNLFLFQNRFQEETLIWRHLAKTSPMSIPKLFAIETITTFENEHFGIIVTEFGISLDKIFPRLQIPSTCLVKDEHFTSFFKHFKNISFYTLTNELPFELLKYIELITIDKERMKIKEKVFKNLTDSILNGLAEANVIHRDLKIENLLYLPKSNRVVTCDFGVSVLKNVEMKSGPRGALKYYPIKSIDNTKYYEPWCDEYFASLSLLEILNEDKIFRELDIAQAIDMRRNGN